MLYRTSSQILDTHATGGERVWREIGAALVNRSAASAAWSTAYTNDVAPNGPEHTPSWVAARWTWVGSPSAASALRTPARPVADPVRLPLRRSHRRHGRAPVLDLRVRTERHHDGGIEEAFTHGSLAGRRVGDPDGRNRHALGAMLNYDYSTNPALRSRDAERDGAGSSPTGGCRSAWCCTRRRSRAASCSPASRAAVHRRRRRARLRLRPRLRRPPRRDAADRQHRVAAAGYEANLIGTVNGTDGNHTLQRALVRARVEVSRRFGFGAGYKWRQIHSRYTATRTTSRTSRAAPVRVDGRAALELLTPSAAGPAPAAGYQLSVPVKLKTQRVTVPFWKKMVWASPVSSPRLWTCSAADPSSPHRERPRCGRAAAQGPPRCARCSAAGSPRTPACGPTARPVSHRRAERHHLLQPVPADP